MSCWLSHLLQLLKSDWYKKNCSLFYSAKVSRWHLTLVHSWIVLCFPHLTRLCKLSESYEDIWAKQEKEVAWDNWTDRCLEEVIFKKCGSNPIISLHLLLSPSVTLCRPVSFLWRSFWLCTATQCQNQRRRPVPWLPASQTWHWTRWDTTPRTRKNRSEILLVYSVLLGFLLYCAVLLLFICFVQDQITEDLFPGEEEEESSADDLTPSVTSNTSDLLRRLQGKAHKDLHLHMTIWHLKSSPSKRKVSKFKQP